MKQWKIDKEGKYIIVKKLMGDQFVPTIMFDGLSPFHRWALEIGEQCKEMADLGDEIARIYKETFQDEPKGVVVDFVKSLEKIDGIK